MWLRRLRYVLLLAALCAIATCPAAKRACDNNTHSQEAEDLVGYLADRVAIVFASTGKLPPTAAGPTPVPNCCDQGGTCPEDPSVWNTQGWRELGFSIDDEYRYVYQYLPDPSGTSAVVRAVGDLDCDQQTSVYEVKLTVAGTKLVRTWTRTAPAE